MNDVVLSAAPEADRTRFLGGSDAAAVMGLSPWATPVELWMQKTGRAPAQRPDPKRQRMYDRGHKLEPFIREMAMEKLRDEGLAVELVACNQRYTDPEFGFMSCEIDFELRLTGVITIGGAEVFFSGEHVNADAKSVSGFARKKWGEVDTEDVPIEYAAQFMFGLMVTSRRYCLVAALRSFDDVDIYWTVRDDETIAAMRPKLTAFWLQHVIPRVPPDPMKYDDIRALFPLDDGLPIEATPEIADSVQQLRTVKTRLRDLEEAETSLSFEIANHISPHSRLTFKGRDLMTWKGQNDTRLDNDLLAAAEIYRRTPAGEFERIERPVAEFSRTKVIRILRFVKPKKGFIR